MGAIKEGSFVTLFYKIVVDRTSEVVLDTFFSAPATLQIGEGTLNHFFEHCLIGMSAGDSKEFLLSPAESFGHYREDLLKTVKKVFIGKDELYAGQCISFENNGLSVTGTVRNLDVDNVLIDFNHPLAGEHIKFSVSIVGVL